MLTLVKLVDNELRVRYPLTRIYHRLGRDPACDIHLDGEEVSRQHAEITVTAEGAFVNDLDSRNGVFVNDERIGGLRQLRVGDRVRIGGHLFALIDEPPLPIDATIAMSGEAPRHLRLPSADFRPEFDGPLNDTTHAVRPDAAAAVADELSAEERNLPRLVVETGAKRGLRVPLTFPELAIGRSPECHIVLPDTQVSARHARLVRRRGGFYIYDDRSLNGVFVNQTKIRGVRLKPGDVISLGDTRLRFEDPLAPAETTGPSADLSPRPRAMSRYRGWPWIAAGGFAVAILAAVAYLLLR
jgi:pSer/pThr/pTyr-binding forkhead associated (FHA) protein